MVVKDEESPIFVEGESIAMSQDNKNIGVLGRIKEDILQNWDIKSHKVYYAELEIDHLRNLYNSKRKFQSIIEFPSIQRDISLAVKDDIKFSQIKEIVEKLGANILSSINFSEEYLGDKIPSGYRGLVFSLTYQSHERTLKEDEVNAVHEAINQALVKDLQVIKR